MTDAAESEFIEIGDLDSGKWNDYAIEQGWSDGFPLVMPARDIVERFVETCRGDNAPFPPMSPRRLVPTLQAIAANAVMAGCRAEYFPVVVAAVRAVLDPAYNLHGTLATTHPCAQLIIVNGPLRGQLDINCGGIQEKLFEDSAIHISRVPPEKRKNYAIDRSAKVINDKFYLTSSPEHIQVLVAGGPGKHSAYIPTFGSTRECSVRVSNA